MTNFDPSRHRLQFNIDCNVWMYKYREPSAFYRPSGQPLTAADIHRYVDILADGDIDTLTVHAGPMQFAYYPSKRIPTIFDNYRRGDRSFFYGHIIGYEMTPEQIDNYLNDSTHLMDAYLDLLESGVDWLAETAAACRRRKITPWVSIRMNDMHGATPHPDGSYLNCELYKNPEMRLRGTTFNPQAPPENSDRGFNYEKQEVRDFVMDAIEDVVENYDYDGLQLEWNRSPLCCEPGASAAMIDLITDWHDEVRQCTQKRGEQKGEHYALGVKHVGTFDQLRDIGIDLREMARREIIDFVCPTNFWQSSWDIPIKQIKEELGPNVAVYGSIEIAPNWLEGYLPDQFVGNAGLGNELAVNYRLTPFCPPMLRGNAAAKLVAGADGIEVFNFPCADQVSHWPWPDEPGSAQYEALRGIDDLEALRGQTKFYTLSSQTGYYLHQPFETVSPFPGALGPQERRVCRIPMCAENDENLELTIQIVVENRDDSPPLGVYFNGVWPRFDGERDEHLLFAVANMTHHAPTRIGLNFSFPIEDIREGWNEIVVMNGAIKDWSEQNPPELITVFSVELAVREKAVG